MTQIDTSYSKLRKTGIINENCDIINHPQYNRLLNLKYLNKILFGRDSIPKTTSKLHLKTKNIIHEILDTMYLDISKFNEYITCIGDLEEQNDNYICINYYNIIGKELSDKDTKINKFWKDLTYFLQRKQNTINKNILNYIGEDYFKGLVESNMNGLITIKFETVTKPIIVTLGTEDLDHKYYINLNNPDYSKLVKVIKTCLLCENEKSYILHNLVRATGNKAFSELLLSSFENKLEYVVPIYVLENFGFHFKSGKSKEDYKNNFLLKYKENTIYKLVNGEIKLNFEGVNKYFLNLDEKYLLSFQVKEQINELYYSITNELMSSYQILYNYAKNNM